MLKYTEGLRDEAAAAALEREFPDVTEWHHPDGERFVPLFIEAHERRVEWCRTLAFSIATRPCAISKRVRIVRAANRTPGNCDTRCIWHERAGRGLQDAGPAQPTLSSRTSLTIFISCDEGPPERARSSFAGLWL